jgi:signal transduction histidine kinase
MLEQSMFPRISAPRILIASAVAAVGLLIIGWFDYGATRAELLEILREQATGLRQTIAAAARSNDAAAAQVEAQLSERLADNARLLAELDRERAIDQPLLDEIALRNRLFRVAMLGPDGSRELASGMTRGGPGWGFPGPGLQPFVQTLLSGKGPEFVSQMHGPRWGGAPRIVAGVRRAKGGAIVVAAEASDIQALQRQTSLDELVRDIVASTPQLAYVILDRGDVHIAQGEVPASIPASAPVTQEGAGISLAEQEVRTDKLDVLQFSGPVALGEGPEATLRLGLRLDGLRRPERRMVLVLSATLAAALAFSLLALGTVWLSHAYTLLRGKHAAAEAALRRRDRLAAMGELASAVAHEIRNPLNSIAMSAQRLRGEFLDGAERASTEARAELEQLLGAVSGEARRINDIVQQFLEFARPPKLAPREAHLGAEMQQIVDHARPLAESRGVTLEADVAGAGIAVFDPAQLRQAIDNLLRNAIEATPASGKVAIVVRSTSKEHAIEVRDTGVGITPEDLPRIFDLYFTTKPHGTGVGLAVTHQIVGAHGGTIDVDSKPGSGTRMTIHLPVMLEEAASV